MVFARPMAAVSRRLNPLVLPLTRQLPPLAVLHHKGRRSGSSYNTPVQAYHTPDGWVAALQMRVLGIDEFLQFDATPIADRH